MKTYLVIGNPIEHSLSPLVHNYWMKKYNLTNSIYEKKKVEVKDLKKIVDDIRKDQIVGVNVTVPFKKLIIPYLDELDASANDTQSVNTLHKIGNKIIGYNTDCLGFLKTINDYYGLYPSITDKNLPRKDFFILGQPSSRNKYL